MAGNTIFEKISGDDDDKIALQIGISEGPIKSITEIKANDVDITDRCQVKLGSRTQSADPINDLGQTFPYLAYISTELTANENIQGSPTITSIVEGRYVKVWNGSTWTSQYSNNPAWCVLDFLTNKRYGLGIDEQYIDLDSFIDVAAATNWSRMARAGRKSGSNSTMSLTRGSQVSTISGRCWPPSAPIYSIPRANSG